MGKPEKPSPVKLITGIISSSNKAIIWSEKALEKKFGEIDYKSENMEFGFTDYYAGDMGPGLSRCFFSFKNLVEPSALSSIKLFTNKLELDLARSYKTIKRPVNIDPGYITEAKLVLASTKDYAHRIYIDKRIYAEITLYYQRNTFHPHTWTYPDYRSKPYIDIFNCIRDIYMKQRRT
jgi:hypothetical protein